MVCLCGSIPAGQNHQLGSILNHFTPMP